MSQLKRDYNMRLSQANKFDGLIHLENGKRMFVDDGTIVGGVNVYAQKHKNKAHAHDKHPSQHHAGHKKAHKTHKKHAAHKPHAHKKHDAAHAPEKVQAAPEQQQAPQAPSHFVQKHKSAVKNKHHGHKKHATAHHAHTKVHHKKEEASD